jgi:hypothetical protein|tara:strand:+ start:2995 stop:3414 length:420 start_codon:yes stop_codon:yes gene_type:complete
LDNYGLGRFLISEHTIEAGTAAEKMFRVFTAGEKAVAITNGHYVGGDAGDAMQLFLVPPNAFTTGMKPSDQPGVIALTAQGAMRGGQGTVEEPQNVFGVPMDNRWPMTVIPPYGSIACSLDASNTAAMTVRLGGFEINA